MNYPAYREKKKHEIDVRVFLGDEDNYNKLCGQIRDRCLDAGYEDDFADICQDIFLWILSVGVLHYDGTKRFASLQSFFNVMIYRRIDLLKYEHAHTKKVPIWDGWDPYAEIETQVDFSSFKWALRRLRDRTYLSIFCMVCEGYRNIEIAKIINTSNMSVTHALNKIYSFLFDLMMRGSDVQAVQLPTRGQLNSKKVKGGVMGDSSMSGVLNKLNVEFESNRLKIESLESRMKACEDLKVEMFKFASAQIKACRAMKVLLRRAGISKVIDPQRVTKILKHKDIKPPLFKKHRDVKRELPENEDSILTSEVRVGPTNRNGHKRLAVRQLTVEEKDKIREEFLRLNGEITEDAAVSICNSLSPDVSIFQVTGAIVGLHRQVRLGALEVRDRPSYDAALVARRSVKDLMRMGYPVKESDVGRVSKYNQEA